MQLQFYFTSQKYFSCLPQNLNVIKFFTGCGPPVRQTITQGQLNVNADFYEVGDQLIYQCSSGYSIRMGITECQENNGMFQWSLDVTTEEPTCLLGNKFLVSPHAMSLKT